MKTRSIFLSFLTLGLFFAFSSCEKGFGGKESEGGDLNGTWYELFYYNSRIDWDCLSQDEHSCLVISDKTITIDGKSYDYELKSSELIVSGVNWRKVVSADNNTLVLSYTGENDKQNTITYGKTAGLSEYSKLIKGKWEKEDASREHYCIDWDKGEEVEFGEEYSIDFNSLVYTRTITYSDGSSEERVYSYPILVLNTKWLLLETTEGKRRYTLYKKI